MLRYHGVFAPRARLRQAVVPAAATEQGSHTSQQPDTVRRASVPRCRMEWAKLMQRVFAIDVLQCPKCSSRMQRISFITQPRVIKAILEVVGYYAADPPELSVA